MRDTAILKDTALKKFTIQEYQNLVTRPYKDYTKDRYAHPTRFTQIFYSKNENFNTDSIALHTDGKSLGKQTYENTCDNVLGSASGFAYDTTLYTQAQSTPTYSLPTPTAIITENIKLASYTFGSTEGSDVPNESVDAGPNTFVLTLITNLNEADRAISILRDCKASNVHIK